jgi:hypothetical protein
VSARRAKRDEWSCPCCGGSTDGGYCEACLAFECGEQHVDSPDSCLVPRNVVVTRHAHAAHYSPEHPARGHDLIVVEVIIRAGEETPFNSRGEPEVRPPGLPSEFKYHSGSRIPGASSWRFVKTAPLSPGRCGRCA